MVETFDAFRYISYLRSRWRFIAVCCAVAVTLAIVASVTARKQYTATARVVIEPPAGTDLRSAMAVSPIYLESLKTYEQLASSDSQFQRAVQKFGLASGSIESLKRRRGRRLFSIRSSDINVYIKEATGGDFSAKDFRTWHATVVAAVCLSSPDACAAKSANRSASKIRRRSAST